MLIQADAGTDQRRTEVMRKYVGAVSIAFLDVVILL